MKNVVITGSTRGVGLRMAKSFLKRGLNVTVSGTGEDSLQKACKELSEFSAQAQFVVCNVCKPEDIENLWQQSSQKWGSVDIWINNAGINQPHREIAQLKPESISEVIDTNIKGMINGSRIAAREMLLQGSGYIYNMEGMGSNNMYAKGASIYGTTKRALTYFTIALAKELEGTPVKAGRLSPGMMLTDFIISPVKGETSVAIENKSFKKVFNILADTPETVAEYLVPEMLKNRINNSRIVWLTNRKVMLRFCKSMFKKRELIK